MVSLFLKVNLLITLWRRKLAWRMHDTNTHMFPIMSSYQNMNNEYLFIKAFTGVWVLLLYLTSNRPEITFSMGVCSHYQANTKVIHLTQVKHIIKYIIGASDYKLLYSFDTNSSMVGYWDIGWEDNLKIWKNTFGGCFFLWINLMSWFSKKK